MLALATCYCNDVYREANEKVIKIDRLEVEAEFVSKGEPAKNVTYGADVSVRATKEEMEHFLRDTDRVAEIQNTLRKGAEVNANGDSGKSCKPRAGSE